MNNIKNQIQIKKNNRDVIKTKEHEAAQKEFENIKLLEKREKEIRFQEERKLKESFLAGNRIMLENKIKKKENDRSFNIEKESKEIDFLNRLIQEEKYNKSLNTVQKIQGFHQHLDNQLREKQAIKEREKFINKVLDSQPNTLITNSLAGQSELFQKPGKKLFKRNEDRVLPSIIG